MCNTNDATHWVVNDKYVCNWCVPASDYGETGGGLSVPADCRTAKGDVSPCQPAPNADARVTKKK
jgi:hypothetical protein